MAVYEVETEDSIFDVEADSEEEARQIVESGSSQPFDSTGDRYNIPPETRTGLSTLIENTRVPENIPLIGGQTAPQIAQMPERGFRGLAVGAQRLAQGIPATNLLLPGQSLTPGDVSRIVKNAPAALERASEATQPGFQPTSTGEAIAATTGQAVGGLPLAMGLGGTGTPKTVAQTALQVLRQGTTNATIRAVSDASDKGDVDVDDVLFSGTLGAFFPVISPAFGRIAGITDEAAKLGVTSSTSLSREAVEGLQQNPKDIANLIAKTEGVRTEVIRLQENMVNHFKKIGGKLRETRLRYGVTVPFEESLDDAITKGFPTRSGQEIAKDFKDVERGFKVITKEVPVSKIAKPTGGFFGSEQPRIKEKIVRFTPKERLNMLYEMRREIDIANARKQNPMATIQNIPHVPDDEEVLMTGIRKRINPILDDEVTPQVPGSKVLRLMDEAYKQAREMYDSFAQKLATPGKAEQVLERIYRKGDPNEIIGINKDVRDVLTRLERKTGERYIEPLMEELSAREFRTIKGKGFGGFASLFTAPAGAVIAGGLGPQGAAGALRSIFGLTSGVRKLGELASSSAARALSATIRPPQTQGAEQ